MTPKVTWEEPFPYIRANIVAQLKDREFHVFVYRDQTDRCAVKPFDQGPTVNSAAVPNSLSRHLSSAKTFVGGSKHGEREGILAAVIMTAR